MATLGDFIKIKHGYAFKGDYISTEDNGIVLVTPGNFNIGGGFKEQKCKFFTSDYPQEYVLKEDDLIVTMTDLSKAVDTLGYSALIPKSEDRIYLHNQRIGLVQILDNNIDKHFLYWFMRTPIYQKRIAATSTGSTVHHTSPDRIGEVEIDILELEVQKRIANCMDVIDKKIKINEKINRNLEEQARLLYKSWFMDYEPYGGEIPDDWSIGMVNDLASDIICGKTPSTKKEEYYGNDVPFVTIPDMHGSVYTVKTQRQLSTLGAESQRGKTVPKNTICVSCIGTAGLVSLVPVRSQTNQQINSIIPKTAFSPYYIYLLMLTMGETINKLGQGGSTIVNLNKTQFGKMEVLVPAISAMKDFDNIVQPIFAQILLNQMENIRLEELRDSLLPKLMSGELDVSNLDI